MSKSTRELATFIGQHVRQYRTGPEVVQDGAVTHVYAMPPEEEATGSLIDVGFFKAECTTQDGDKERLLTLLEAALHSEGASAPMSVKEFLAGQSYIVTGAWIGDQGVALCLYALLEHLDLAGVITPATLGATGAQATELMGRGFVLMAPRTELQERLSEAPAPDEVLADSH